MTKFNILIILSLLLSLKIVGQVKINKPVSIPITGKFDSIRLAISKACLGDTILNSKASFDLRIYRFMAFGDNKLIRISLIDKSTLEADLYSLDRNNKKIKYHKKYHNWGTSLKLKALLSDFDILNIPDLDFKIVTNDSLPLINDGNIYKIEAKVGRDFTYKEYENPEIYARYYFDKIKQAVFFSDFIRQLEKILGVKISEPEF